MTSNPGEESVEKVAADSNVLLSAVAGKAALKVFTKTSVTVVTTSANLAEVREYLPVMASLYDLLPEVLEAQLRLLNLEPLDQDQYQRTVPDARRRIGQRDPDDVDLLALALFLEIPVWSNDNDFEEAGVEWYTTAELLKKLEVK